MIAGRWSDFFFTQRWGVARGGKNKNEAILSHERERGEFSTLRRPRKVWRRKIRYAPLLQRGAKNHENPTEKEKKRRGPDLPIYFGERETGIKAHNGTPRGTK